MSETILKIIRALQAQGKNPTSMVVPLDFFMRLAQDLKIEPFPQEFHFVGVRIRYGHRFEVEF